MTRAEESLVGRTIAGKFTIEAHIGSGAMGQVYRARQLALEKTVAVKVLHGDLAQDPTFAARFHREAMAASRLDHPNSMRVIDFGAEPDGMLYIAMEYLDGRDLHRIIHEDGTLPEARVVDILVQALGALVVAHDMGVIHRDLKPENIMILEGLDDEGQPIDIVKVCDFGIAKINTKTLSGVSDSGRAALTTQGLVVGTPEYMSPEQGRGDPLDARADLYSVGVMMFQLLTGRLPFQAETALGLVFKQVNEPAPTPSSFRAGIDPHLEAVCLKALSKRPEERFQSAREMRSALKAFFGTDNRLVPSSAITLPRPRETAMMEHAETVSLPVSAPRTTSEVSGVSRPDTAPLPELPVSQPSVWWVGAVALVAGALLVAGVWARWFQAAPVQAGGVVDAAVASASDAQTDAALSRPVALSSSAPPAASSIAVLGSHPGAPPPHAPHAPRAPHPEPAAGAGAASDGRFDLAVAAAVPSVSRASGVAARDVREGLPSWKFTECYRSALTHANRALDGHVTLSLTFDGNGTVTKVTARGAGPLLSATGDCMMDAIGHATVKHAPAGGGSADVDIACTPR
jgi:serine/threonine-protein kinase